MKWVILIHYSNTTININAGISSLNSLISRWKLFRYIEIMLKIISETRCPIKMVLQINRKLIIKLLQILIGANNTYIIGRLLITVPIFTLELPKGSM